MTEDGMYNNKNIKLNVFVIVKIRLVVLLMTVVMLMVLPTCSLLNTRNCILAFLMILVR